MDKEKFRGKSIYQVAWRLEETRKIRSALFTMQKISQNQIHLLEKEAKEHLIGLGLEELEGMSAEDIGLGLHECTGAPLKRCIYNTTEDIYHDTCLYCGEPHERK